MKIHLQKKSRVPLVDQLVGQIQFLIASGDLRAGEVLPSRRELAHRYGIHRNTAGNAYEILKEKGFVVSRHGAKMVVSDLSRSERSRIEGLDGLIDNFIAMARHSGYTARQLGMRVQDRLLGEPPDHVLIVTKDDGLRQILDYELELSLKCPIETCSPDELISNPGLAIAAVVIAAPGSVRRIQKALPELNPLLAAEFSSADSVVQRIATLEKASLIAIVSISPLFLETAMAILEPVVDKRHELIDLTFRADNVPSLGAVDLAFCDAVAYRRMKSGKAFYYQLASPSFVKTLAGELGLS